VVSHNPDKQTLKNIRDAIDYDGRSFHDIFDNKSFKDFFGGLLLYRTTKTKQKRLRQRPYVS
jgi:hypothetical protein